MALLSSARKGLLRGALALAVTGLVVGVVAAPAAAAPKAPAELVVFGDSYSAGIGAGAMAPNPQNPACYQAAPGYGEMLAERKQLELVLNTACYGSTAVSVQQQIGFAAQGGYLDADTDLVTITAGGNDVDFGGILRACTQSAEACAQAIAVGTSIVPGVHAALVADYTLVRQHAPGATIVALGYPHLLDASLAGTGMISAEAIALFNAGTDMLNAAIADAASQVPGVVYGDVVNKFAGHGVGAADSWIWFDPTGQDLNTFHPTPAGYKGGYYPTVMSAVSPGQLKNVAVGCVGPRHPVVSGVNVRPTRAPYDPASLICA